MDEPHVADSARHRPVTARSLYSRYRRAVGNPRMYNELASWFHLVSDPAEYADEAADILRRLADHGVELFRAGLSRDFLRPSGSWPMCRWMRGDARCSSVYVGRRTGWRWRMVRKD